MQKKESGEEEYVFEFYDEDYAKSLEEVEKPVKVEEFFPETLRFLVRSESHST